MVVWLSMSSARPGLEGGPGEVHSVRCGGLCPGYFPLELRSPIRRSTVLASQAAMAAAEPLSRVPSPSIQPIALSSRATNMARIAGNTRCDHREQQKPSLRCAAVSGPARHWSSSIANTTATATPSTGFGAPNGRSILESVGPLDVVLSGTAQTHS